MNGHIASIFRMEEGATKLYDVKTQQMVILTATETATVVRG